MLNTGVSFADDQSGGEDDDDDRAFSQINALSSPASTPPQVGLPDSPDLSEKINGPSASMITTVEPLPLLHSPGEPERALSHRTSGSADDVEAELVPTSPTPSLNASQNANPNSPSPHILSHTPAQTQSRFPVADINMFRRARFQMNRPPTQTSLRFGFGTSTPQSQGRPTASQALRSPVGSQVSPPSSQNGDGMSWMNTQAFRLPETQGSYESD